MNYHQRILNILLVFSLLLTPALAQQQQAEKETASFNPSIKRVAVFKNGYVFTYREGEAKPENSWTYTTDVPTGVLGAVWGYSATPNVKVVQLLASEVEKKQPYRVAGIEELLMVNEGSNVRIKTDYTDKIFEGSYVVLSPQRTFPVGERGERVRNIGLTKTDNNDLDIALKTSSGLMVIKASRITYVEMPDQPQWSKIVSKRERRLGIKTENHQAGQSINLGIAALERGIRWIPAYRLEVRGEPIKEARLELEAMIINELADINDAEIYFVVGVPHFLFREQISPLSLNSTFAGLSGFFRQDANRRMSNAMMTQVANRADSAGEGVDAPAAIEDSSMPAMSADQLFLYRANNIALKKGERASVRLFSMNVPCSEIFEWTIEDSVPQARRNEPSEPSVQDLSRGIWHAVKLKNQTNMPWTTGPVINFREWKPLGQDIMTFTPVGEENIVRVTPATEVVGTHKLTEKERVRQVIREGSSNYEYDLVTLEGVINLRNVKKQPVNIIITRPLTGEALAASENGRIQREGIDLQSVNPRSVIKWELTLPPGEKQLSYTYKVFVRR